MFDGNISHPDDIWAHIRANPQLTVAEALALHKRAYGLKGEQSIAHELGHLLLALVGFPHPQVDYEVESYVLPLEEVLGRAIIGLSAGWNKKNFHRRVEAETASLEGEENLLRTLAHLMAPAFQTTARQLRCKDDDDEWLVNQAVDKHQISIRHPDVPNAGTVCWEIEMDSGSTYTFQRRPTGTVCDLPHGVTPVCVPTQEQTDVWFDKIDRAVTGLLDEITQFPGTRAPNNNADSNAVQEMLGQLTIGWLLDRLDVAGPNPADAPSAPISNEGPRPTRRPA